LIKNKINLSKFKTNQPDKVLFYLKNKQKI
jgi:hypothetical protein